MQFITGPKNRAMQTINSLDLHRLKNNKYCAEIDEGYEYRAIISEYYRFFGKLIICWISNAHIRNESDPIELYQEYGDLKQIKEIAEFIEKELKLSVIVRTR